MVRPRGHLSAVATRRGGACQGRGPKTLAEITAAIARLEVVIDGQCGLAQRLPDAGFEPVGTVQLVETGAALAVLRARKAGRRYGHLS